MIENSNYFIEDVTFCKHDYKLEFRTEESIPTSAGLKVEIVAISGPVSFDSGDNHFSNLNHLIRIYSKKRCSLNSHSNLIVSKTLHLSPLITKLQI